MTHDYLTINEAAEYLRIKRNCFHKWRRGKVVMVTKNGGKVYVSKKHLDDLLANGPKKYVPKTRKKKVVVGPNVISMGDYRG